ncbi:carbohydrate kinase family protein [soil metagenome]
MTAEARRSRVAVVGYASVDRAITVATPLHPGRTSIVTGPGGELADSSQGTAGEPGGIGYAATALAACGVPTHAVTWIGDDPAGRVYAGRLRESGVEIDGLDIAGPVSPSSLMVYEPDGVCTCLFDPGSGAADRLTSAQREIVARSTHIVLMVAPAAITAQVLDLIEGQGLTFVMKADEQAQPDGTCAAAIARADSVFCNHVERDLIEPWLHGEQTVVTTAGAGAVRVEHHGESALIENPDVFRGTMDLTGAGDTLMGACLASMLTGADIAGSVRAGMAAATSLLRARVGQGR